MNRFKPLALQDLDVPPRPKLVIERDHHHEPLQTKDVNANVTPNPPEVIRLTSTWIWEWNHSMIEKFDIFVSVQRINAAFATQWTKIGEIPVKKEKYQKLEDFKSQEHATRRVNANVKLTVSRRMSGFASGFRYQIAVRGVDIGGREGPYSIPVSIQV